jgi:hypothetical protein
VILAFAQTAQAREHHFRQAINHRQANYVYRGAWQGTYARQRTYASQSSAWGADDQGRWNRRGDWSAWNGSDAQPARRYGRWTRQAGAWSARTRYTRFGAASAGGYRAAHRGRFAAAYGGAEERTPAYRGGFGPRPGAWCGWEMRQLVGHDPGPGFNLARKWAQWGHAGPPGIGAIVVWPHHVGMIVGRENGQWIIKSGNDGNRVRVRPLPIARAIAIRWTS